MKKIEKVVFLDRDGVINQYPGDRLYVTRFKDFKLIKGALEAMARLTKAGYKIFVISNQAGVSKGLYSKGDLDHMTSFLLRKAKNLGGIIHGVFYCTHPKEMNCSCRKPKTGLLKNATRGLRIDRKNSYFVGDSLKDVLAGRKFGVKTVLVFSGREKLKNAPQWDILPDFVALNLSQAADNILKKKYERA